MSHSLRCAEEESRLMKMAMGRLMLISGLRQLPIKPTVAEVTKMKVNQSNLIVPFLNHFFYSSVDADTNIPFNTQFFQDDYDDGPGFGPGFDDDGDGFGVPPDVDDEEQDLLLSTQNPMKRPSRQTVNYTKRAKRVDVRKLKDNIWKGLDIAVPQKRSEKHMVKDGDEDIYSDEEDGMVRSPSISVIQNDSVIK